MASDAPTVEEVLRGRPQLLETYAALRAALNAQSAIEEDAKKISIHIKPKRGGSAFAGVHPRRAGILLNIRTAKPIVSLRVSKVEQVSRSRFHNELILASPADVDTELLAWLAAAHALSLPD